jgi:flagellar biosynthesis/type III secretory pathway protein FliH
MGVGFNPLPIYTMKQHRTLLTNFVKRIKREAFKEGFKKGFRKGMNTKQWDQDIEKTIPEKIRYRPTSELLKDLEK